MNDGLQEAKSAPIRVDPTAEARDVAPELMTPDERRQAAARTLYEWERAMVAAGVAAEYMAELAGLNDDEVEAVQNQAEKDEYHALGFEGEQDALKATSPMG